MVARLRHRGTALQYDPDLATWIKGLPSLRVLPLRPLQRL